MENRTKTTSFIEHLKYLGGRMNSLNSHHYSDSILKNMYEGAYSGAAREAFLGTSIAVALGTYDIFNIIND